jgi:hypothetical protein
MKINKYLPYDLVICTLGHLSQRNEKLCLYKNLYTNIHKSFIHNNKILGKSPQMIKK